MAKTFAAMWDMLLLVTGYLIVKSKCMPSGSHHHILSFILYLSTNLMDSLQEAKIIISLPTHTSLVKWFLGAGRWKLFPSNNKRKLSHKISSLVHPNSYRKWLQLYLLPPSHMHHWQVLRMWKIFFLVATVETFCHSYSRTCNNDVSRF